MSKKKKTSGTENVNGATDDASGKTHTEQVRELVVCVGIAVLLAYVIKYVLIEVFVIPSGSMEPTLHGRPDGGDRVLCTKLNYLWRDPQRWEIFVFLFPYEQAAAALRENGNETGSIADYKGQNFIKRCVGLPGEQIQIARGDIFTKGVQETFWTRQVKPDSVQRGMWIPVYEEDFGELLVNGKGQVNDLDIFWRRSGYPDSTWNIEADATLRVTASEGAHLQYRPRIRGGLTAEELTEYPYRSMPRREVNPELTAVPDRYVVRQAVTFECSHCGELFRKTAWNQKIAGRCPHCHAYATEESVTFYDRRSDLPVSGPFEPAGSTVMSDRMKPHQGESNKRYYDYRPVTDLRVVCRVKIDEGAHLAIELADGRGVDPSAGRDAPHVQRLTAELSGGQNGQASIRMDGRPAPADRKRVVNLGGNDWHTVEFYSVDGMARLYVDDTETPLLEWNHKENVGPTGLYPPTRSGIMLSVYGGTVAFDSLRIDRDVQYFSKDEGLRRDDPFASGYDWGHPHEVSPSGYMALGDNSPSSNDSRDWGDVPIENRRGPAILIWWPPRRIHWIGSPVE